MNTRGIGSPGMMADLVVTGGISPGMVANLIMVDSLAADHARSFTSVETMSVRVIRDIDKLSMLLIEEWAGQIVEALVFDVGITGTNAQRGMGMMDKIDLQKAPLPLMDQHAQGVLEQEEVRPNIDYVATTAWLAAALDVISRPTTRINEPLPFDPDDYPVV